MSHLLSSFCSRNGTVQLHLFLVHKVHALCIPLLHTRPLGLLRHHICDGLTAGPGILGISHASQPLFWINSTCTVHTVKGNKYTRGGGGFLLSSSSGPSPVSWDSNQGSPPSFTLCFSIPCKHCSQIQYRYSLTKGGGRGVNPSHTTAESLGFYTYFSMST